MWLKTYKINNEYVKAFSIKLFKSYLFSMQYHKDGGWFRIFKIGIAWTRIPLFSVRNGYKKSLKIRNNYYTFLS
jgi:hypothetical protein